MYKLTIIADDFGYGFSRNCGILECFQKHGISAVSMLPNCKYSNHAIELVKQYNIPAGLHFNLTEGRPISNPTSISSLLSPSGTFLGKSEFWSRSNFQATHVETEVNAQINWFKNAFGKCPRHVDGHQHVHVHPNVISKFAEALAKHGVKHTRLPLEHECSSFNHSITTQRKEFHDRIENLSRDCAGIFDIFRIKRADAFIGLNLLGTAMTAKTLQRTLLSVFQTGNSSCELMVHPGYKCDPINDGFLGENSADTFSCSSDREHELEVLTCEEMLNFYKQENISLILSS